MATPTPPRRFKPEPVETSSKSTRKFAPEPIEVTMKGTRRFMPEPVETSTKSSRKLLPEPLETTKKSTRRFAPEPVETSVKSNRQDNTTRPLNARSRFAPIPLESTTRSSRHKPDDPQPTSPQDVEMTGPTDQPKPAPRKFAPQLIETAKRTRKAGDSRPALLPSDRTEAVPGPSIPKFREPKYRENRPRLIPAPPENTPIVSSDNLHDILEARRLGVPITSRQCSMSSTRSHSFRVPDLEPIDSSQSEESNPPSLSSSPSGASDQSFMYKHATRIRESVDDRYSGYLLQIAAKAAENQLRDQALAAFPNDDKHEPVDHFIDRDMDESGSRGRHSGTSFVQVNWELKEMQAHQERLSQQKEQQAASRPTHEPAEQKPDPWGNPAAALFAGAPRDRELERMQKGARPPMLGDDIRFPRCPSPEPARFDVTQGSQALRDSMCYLTEQTQVQEEDHEGLWAQKKNISQKPTLWSNPGSRPPSRGGLWGGCCVNTGATPPRGRSGLLTPRKEIDNPFDTPSPSPQPGSAPSLFVSACPDFVNIDERLQAELTIEEEFDEAFITQVYNYLSLGYPSIARDYDEELSKISRISISELRQDDHLADIRGYVRLGEDESPVVSEDNCMRWRALRLYIYEWGRQQPRMISGAYSLGGFGFGAAARKGSWAI